MSDPPSGSIPGRRLALVARGAILWGAGFTLIRDLLHFATMLVLVRLLSPDDYGRFALAQTILGLLSVMSAKTFVAHALQLQDPETVNWSGHFTASVIINSILFALAGVISISLLQTEKYSAIALPLFVLSSVLLIEIFSDLRHTMLQAVHDWKRFRIIALCGAFLGSASAIGVAYWGGHVWALVTPVLLLGVPGAIDLLLFSNWRPKWNLAQYSKSVRFGFGRMSSAGVIAMRQLTEQITLSRYTDFSGLGIFTRALGLASITAGRIGSVSVSSLYPVLTRAAPYSDSFRVMSAILFRGVSWVTMPIAGFSVLFASEIVAILYGERWSAVTALLPFAAVHVALATLAATIYALILASNAIRLCFFIDLATAVLGIVLAFVLIPYGVKAYFVSLACLSAFCLLTQIAIAFYRRLITLTGVLTALIPPVATLAFAFVIFLMMHRFFPNDIFPRLFVGAGGFAGLYVLMLRMGFAKQLKELLDFAPAGQRLISILRLRKN